MRSALWDIWLLVLTPLFSLTWHYAISLTAIKLDTKEEEEDLRQLAKALRISPEQCNQLQQQQNAPLMYQA